jgi:heterodisulfide reductase subunit B
MEFEKELMPVGAQHRCEYDTTFHCIKCNDSPTDLDTIETVYKFHLAEINRRHNETGAFWKNDMKFRKRRGDTNV